MPGKLTPCRDDLVRIDRDPVRLNELEKQEPVVLGCPCDMRSISAQPRSLRLFLQDIGIVMAINACLQGKGVD